MSLTRWWHSRHSVVKSGSLDEIDEINAGKIFKIRYLGCRNLGENERCDFHKTADGLLNNFSRKTLEKFPALELFIDSNSLSMSGTHCPSLSNSLLEVSLSDVRDIFYRKKDRHYCKICIFVARHLPLSSGLKAHVVYCDSSNLAEELFETFRSAFHAFSQKAKVRSIYPELSVYTAPEVTKEITQYVSKESAVSTLCDINDNGLD